jgi:hypothetical protein
MENAGDVVVTVVLGILVVIGQRVFVIILVLVLWRRRRLPCFDNEAAVGGQTGSPRRRGTPLSSSRRAQSRAGAPASESTMKAGSTQRYGGKYHRLRRISPLLAGSRIGTGGTGTRRWLSRQPPLGRCTSRQPSHDIQFWCTSHQPSHGIQFWCTSRATSTRSGILCVISAPMAVGKVRSMNN